MTSRIPHSNSIVHRNQLLAALSRPELHDVSATGQGNRAALESAYQLALALGRCRIFGTNPGPDLDGTIPASLALAAARELLVLLEGWKEEANSLEQSWLACKDSFQTENLCMEILADRMDAWAAFIAIDESCSRKCEGNDAASEQFSEVIDTLTDSLEAFDDALAKHEDLLSCVTETPLLENWRQELSTPYRETLPWWLDGRLEDTARCSQEEALSSMPGESLWRTLRAAHRQVGMFLLPELLDPATVAQSVPASTHVLRWLSPDNELRAELCLPDVSSTEAEMLPRSLNIIHIKSGETVRLEDRTVRLAGFDRELGEDGRAQFTLAELRRAQNNVLLIGGQTWTFEDR
jgi:hypothetical protein